MLVHAQPANMNITSATGARRAALAPSIDTLVVVPCYNEEKRLDPAAFIDFVRARPQTGFLFVDDGSRDDTLHILLSMHLACPRQIDVLKLARNSGKAEAVRAGLEHATSTGVARVGYWDADLATPLDAIDDFSAVMRRHRDVEIVFGARRMLMGHRINRTWNRRLVSRICATLARIAISLPVSDTQCGAKMLCNTPALRAAVSAPFTAGWLFDVELFSRLARLTSRPERSFYEFPLSEWEEVAGSKITGKAIVRAGFSVLGLIWRNRVVGSSLPQAVLSGKFDHAPQAANQDEVAGLAKAA